MIKKNLMSNIHSIKIDNKIFILLLFSLLIVTIIIFKNYVSPASADYHEDSTQQVLVIELGDNTINKIAELLKKPQTVELSEKTIQKLKESQEISISSDSILGLKEEQTLSLTQETLDILKSNQSVSICNESGEICAEINSTGLKTSTYHRNSSN